MQMSITIASRDNHSFVTLAHEPRSWVHWVEFSHREKGKATRFVRTLIPFARYAMLVAILAPYVPHGVTIPRYTVGAFPEIGVFLDQMVDAGALSFEQRGLFV